MLFAKNLVATIRADLDAIKDDLGEFVTTVKTDTTSMLGLADNPGGNDKTNSTSATSKFLDWEEELWDNPDLLCEDPSADDWETFKSSNPVKEEEAETLLSGNSSDLIPELYRELVPARTTHSDFFLRLVYHRNRMTQAVKSKMQELVMDDEEETRWDDEDADEPVRPVVITPAAPASVTVSHPAADTAALDSARAEADALRAELSRVKEELAKSQATVHELVTQLEASKLAYSTLAAAAQDLPHKKAAPEPVKEDQIYMPAPSATPGTTTTTTSWEALPTSPNSSSNEEPVLVTKSGEEEEDDWE